jgi:hypothetical protein
VARDREKDRRAWDIGRRLTGTLVDRRIALPSVSQAGTMTVS